MPCGGHGKAGSSIATWFVLGATFDLDTQEGRVGGGPFRSVHNLNSMHRLWLHPPDTPFAGMNGSIRARLVPHTAIRAQIVNVWGLATRIPIQKETRPTVVMHRLCGA